MALKEYLKQYTYTTSPGTLPKGRELSEYFLLESKQGYCTYFATALATMGRSLGIPMRYVEGAILDYKLMKGDERYIIRSSKAHAWAEAYFEGVGWVIFEATPGYDVLSISSWPSEEMVAELKARKQEEGLASKAMNQQQPNELAEAVLEIEKKQPIDMKDLINKLLMGLGMIAVIFIMLLIMLMLYIKWQYNSCYQRGDTNKRFKLLFYELLGILAQQGLKLEENETLMQFEERLRETKGEDAVGLITLCKEYRGLRYGKHPIDGEVVKKAKIACQSQLAICRQKHGRVRTYWAYVKNQYEIIKKINCSLLFCNKNN